MLSLVHSLNFPRRGSQPVATHVGIEMTLSDSALLTEQTLALKGVLQYVVVTEMWSVRTRT